MTEFPQNRSWYAATWFTILMLVFFAPAGIVLLWLYRPWSTKIKGIVSGVSLVWFLFASLSNDSDKTKTATTMTATQQASPPVPASSPPPAASPVPPPAPKPEPKSSPAAPPKQAVKRDSPSKTQALLRDLKAAWRDSKAAPARPPAKRTMVGDLAIIEGVQNDPEKTARIRSLLAQLDALYPENQQKIGDITAAAYTQLEKEGQEESIIGIMESMIRASPGARQAGQSYGDVSTAYVMLRKNGFR